MRQILVFGVLLLMIHRSAFAALGGDVDSIASDAARMNLNTPDGHVSMLASTTHTLFATHEIAPQKFKLHEFAAKNGKIFAISWCGRGRPDAETVFGAHFDEFKAAIQKLQQSHNRRGSVVEIGNFHLEISASGIYSCARSWLIDQLPEGVSTDDLR